MSKLKLLVSLFVVSSTFVLPSFADEIKEDKHEKDEAKHDTNYKPIFKEGTLNIVSPYTFKQDTLNILYSHNYFLNSFPRGSNPAFHFAYAPIDRLQLDVDLTLRTPLEIEGGVKYQILDEYSGDMFSLAPRLAFNSRGNIAAVDISASKVFFDDTFQIGLDYRAFNYFGDAKKIDNLDSPFVQALGVNSILRVWKHWAIFGDAVIPFDGNLISKKGFIWGAGIKKRLNGTPHVLTIYTGNSSESVTSARTISEGNKYPDMLKVGFNFSINIGHLTKLPEKLF